MSSCWAVRAGRRGGGGGAPAAAGGRAGSEGLWKKRGGRAATTRQAALSISVSVKPNSFLSIVSGACGN